MILSREVSELSDKGDSAKTNSVFQPLRPSTPAKSERRLTSLAHVGHAYLRVDYASGLSSFLFSFLSPMLCFSFYKPSRHARLQHSDRDRLDFPTMEPTELSLERVTHINQSTSSVLEQGSATMRCEGLWRYRGSALL